MRPSVPKRILATHDDSYARRAGRCVKIRKGGLGGMKGGKELSPREQLVSGEPSPGECVFVFVGVFTF